MFMRCYISVFHDMHYILAIMFEEYMFFNEGMGGSSSSPIGMKGLKHFVNMTLYPLYSQISLDSNFRDKSHAIFLFNPLNIIYSYGIPYK